MPTRPSPPAAGSPFDQWLARLPGSAPLAGATQAWHATIARDDLEAQCRNAHGLGARLAALWARRDAAANGGVVLHVLLAFDAGLAWLEVPLPSAEPAYPDLSPIFAPAVRMQRAVRDLVGVVATGGDDQPWLRHAAWPRDACPARQGVSTEARFPEARDDYRFTMVEGDGVHEIPVGPVHAGIIEPGHFRFSVVGEKVVRLEERLGYVHKGIDRRFGDLDLTEGARLAARVSGDSTCAFGWAYAMAAESIAATDVPIRAVAIRALILERERIANHLGDLGYLGNDGGLAFGLAQFMRLKEDVLRVNAATFGHRYMMDVIRPGGCGRDLSKEAAAMIAAQCTALAGEVRTLRDIYEDHAGLQDRFQACGSLTTALATQLGVVGLAARASGIAMDARVVPGFEPYHRFTPRVVTATAGDVAARAQVRFEEILESLRLVGAILENLPPGPVHATLRYPAGPGRGLGRVEGWRGEAIVAIEAAGGRIVRAHAHDPSWQNWPALEHAILGNIVPDFPLVNKSFNLSYSGQDL